MPWALSGPWSRSFPLCPWGTIWRAWGKVCTNRHRRKAGPGEETWINAATILARNNLAWAVLSGAGRYGETVHPAAVAAGHGRSTAAAAGSFFFDVLLQGDAEPTETVNDPDSKDTLRRAAYAVIARPEFQLA